MAADAANKKAEREALRGVIQQWNANRLDLFELSEPNEDLEFHGVMRFYFQDSGQKVATKCIRVASDATSQAVIETLIEKFRPDMRMLSVPEYALYEIHENGEERKLGLEEKPLLVQLNWHIDDREGRFLLRRIDDKTNAQGVGFGEGTSFRRKLSKREKKQMKKQEKLSRLKSAEQDENTAPVDPNGVAEKLYTELPETSFTRSISNPEAVMRRRRQQKLERKLQQFRSKDGGPDTGGTLKIYGEALCKDVPYKTLLLSVRDSAAQVVREMLSKYGLDKVDPQQYCLVQVNSETSTGNAHQEYILDDDECPLAILMNHPSTRGSIMFHVRRRPADYVPRKRKKKPAGKWSELDHRYEDERLPFLLELNPDGTDIPNGTGVKHRLQPNVTEVGSERPIGPQAVQAQTLTLTGPTVMPRHCVIAFTENIVTLTPCSRDAHTYVNNQRIHQTTILQNGAIIKFGRMHTFRFIDPAPEDRIRQRQEPSRQMDYVYDRRSPDVTSQDINSDKYRSTTPNEVQQETSSNPPSPTKSGSVNPRGVTGAQQAIEGGTHNYETTFDLDGNVETASLTSSRDSNRLSQQYDRQPRGTDPILPAVLEFLEETEQTFFHAVITDVEPSAPQFKLAPTYTLYLAARYRASTHYRSELQPTERAHRLTVMLANVATMIQRVIQERYMDASSLALWLANGSELLHMLKSDRHVGAFSTRAQDILAEAVQTAFASLVQCVSLELAPAMSQFMSDADEPAKEAGVLQIFNNTMALLRRCRVNAALTIQLFSHLFHTINATAFNTLVSNGNLCVRWMGRRLKSRLNALENWAERQGLELASQCHLATIMQATHLLQAPKYNAEDLATISSTCFKLNSLQVRALLQKYQPGSDEPRLPPELIENVVRIAESVADALARADGREIRLEEDSTLALALLLPEDGYSCEVIRGVPPGLAEFLAPLQRDGLCRMAPQPTSSGYWTIYMIDHHNNFRSPSAMSNRSGGYNASHVLPNQGQPEIQIIKLHKSSNGMGLSIVAAKGAGQDKLGIYIKSVVAGGAADADGRLTAGDQLLKVDGQSLVGITQEKAAEYLVRTGPIVTLEVAKQGAIYHGLATLLSQPSPVMTRAHKSRPKSEQLDYRMAEACGPSTSHSVGNLLSAMPMLTETYQERLVDWDERIHPGGPSSSHLTPSQLTSPYHPPVLGIPNQCKLLNRQNIHNSCLNIYPIDESPTDEEFLWPRNNGFKGPIPIIQEPNMFLTIPSHYERYPPYPPPPSEFYGDKTDKLALGANEIIPFIDQGEEDSSDINLEGSLGESLESLDGKRDQNDDKPQEKPHCCCHAHMAHCQLHKIYKESLEKNVQETLGGNQEENLPEAREKLVENAGANGNDENLYDEFEDGMKTADFENFYENLDFQRCKTHTSEKGSSTKDFCIENFPKCGKNFDENEENSAENQLEEGAWTKSTKKSVKDSNTSTEDLSSEKFNKRIDDFKVECENLSEFSRNLMKNVRTDEEEDDNSSFSDAERISETFCNITLSSPPKPRPLIPELNLDLTGLHSESSSGRSSPEKCWKSPEDIRLGCGRVAALARHFSKLGEAGLIKFKSVKLSSSRQFVSEPDMASPRSAFGFRNSRKIKDFSKSETDLLKVDKSVATTPERQWSMILLDIQTKDEFNFEQKWKNARQTGQKPNKPSQTSEKCSQKSEKNVQTSSSFGNLKYDSKNCSKLSLEEQEEIIKQLEDFCDLDNVDAPLFIPKIERTREKSDFEPSVTSSLTVQGHWGRSDSCTDVTAKNTVIKGSMSLDNLRNGGSPTILSSLSIRPDVDASKVNKLEKYWSLKDLIPLDNIGISRPTSDPQIFSPNSSLLQIKSTNSNKFGNLMIESRISISEEEGVLVRERGIPTEATATDISHPRTKFPNSFIRTRKKSKSDDLLMDKTAEKMFCFDNKMAASRSMESVKATITLLDHTPSISDEEFRRKLRETRSNMEKYKKMSASEGTSIPIRSLRDSRVLKPVKKKLVVIRKKSKSDLDISERKPTPRFERGDWIFRDFPEGDGSDSRPRRMSERDLPSRLGSETNHHQQIHSSKSVPALHNVGTTEGKQQHEVFNPGYSRASSSNSVTPPVQPPPMPAMNGATTLRSRSSHNLHDPMRMGTLPPSGLMSRQQSSPNLHPPQMTPNESERFYQNLSVYRQEPQMKQQPSPPQPLDDRSTLQKSLRGSQNSLNRPESAHQTLNRDRPISAYIPQGPPQAPGYPMHQMTQPRSQSSRDIIRQEAKLQEMEEEVRRRELRGGNAQMNNRYRPNAYPRPMAPQGPAVRVARPPIGSTPNLAANSPTYNYPPYNYNQNYGQFSKQQQQQIASQYAVVPKKGERMVMENNYVGQQEQRMYPGQYSNGQYGEGRGQNGEGEEQIPSRPALPEETGYRESPPPPPLNTSTHPLYSKQTDSGYTASMQDPPRGSYYPATNQTQGTRQYSYNATNPWQREEREKEAARRREAAKLWRDQQIAELSSLPHRSSQQEEQLRALQLERDFQKRAEEAANQDDDDESTEIDAESAQRVQGLLRMAAERTTQSGTMPNLRTTSNNRNPPVLTPQSVASQVQSTSVPLHTVSSQGQQTYEAANYNSGQFSKTIPGYNDDRQRRIDELKRKQSDFEENQRKEEQMRQMYNKNQMHPGMLRIDNLVINGPSSPGEAPPPPERGSSYAVMSQQSAMRSNTSNTSTNQGLTPKRVSFHDPNANVEVRSPVANSGMDTIREDPNNFINDAETLLASPKTPEGPGGPFTTATPGVIGAQEVYKDPRQKRLAEKQKQQLNSQLGEVPEKLSFKEKIKMFAIETGEDGTPRDKVKISRAQREIDNIGSPLNANNINNNNNSNNNGNNRS